MNTNNFDVKLEALRNGVKLYQIPQKLGMGESTFNHKMRGELSKFDYDRFLEAIKEIASERK